MPPPALLLLLLRDGTADLVVFSSSFGLAPTLRPLLGLVVAARFHILPTVLISAYGVPFYFGGTGLLIIVGVCMQTGAQIEGHLLTQHYDGITEKKSRGGRRKRLQSQNQQK